MKAAPAPLVLIAVASVLIAPATALAAEPTDAVTVLSDGDPLSITTKQDQDTGTVDLPVLNPGEKKAPIEVTLEATSATGLSVSDVSTPEADPGATLVTVTLAGLKSVEKDAVTGQLVVAANGQRSARAVTIKPGLRPSHDWPTCILVVACVVCGALLLVGLVVGRSNLRKAAPGPKWSFDSWATTLTTVGGILGTVLGAAALPEFPQQIDKESLVRLNLLFAVLVVVGPFLFQAIRNPGVPATGQDSGYTGWNGTLLIACAITGAAVSGELVTLGLLGWEIASGGWWGCAVRDAVIVLLAVSLYYFIVTVCRLVSTDWKDEEKKAAKNAAAKAARAAAKPQRFTVEVDEPAASKEHSYDVRFRKIALGREPAATLTVAAAAGAVEADRALVATEAEADTHDEDVWLGPAPGAAASWKLP